MSNAVDFDRLWDYDHPDQSERDFRALLPLRDAPRELELLTQIARAQGLQRRFAEGHATLNEVERRLTTETGTARVRYLLERGRLFHSGGEPERARPLFEQAWEMARQVGEWGYAVDAAHMLGILDTPDLTWNLKALELAETSSDERARRWRASLYNNIGWSYHDQGEYGQALAIFGKALRLREDQGDAKLIRIARWSVARVLRSLGRLDEALAMQRDVAAQARRDGESDGYAEEELGEILLALGRAGEARPHFARAYAELSLDDWLAEHEAERLERLRQLGA
jgi:tetratricopeptide (TPR) repeat protein